MRNKNGTFQAKFSKEQELQICEEYKNKRTMKSIAEEYGCSSTTVRNILLRNDSPIRSRSEAKRIADRVQTNLKEHIFKEINRESAYWLGAIMSDGCITQPTTGHYRLEFSVIASDIKWVEDLAQWLGWKGKIQVRENKGYSGSSSVARIQINNNTLCADLINLGCVERKSLAICKLPLINSIYMNDFIRGYLDGDGSIEAERGRVSFIGNEPFLKAIGEYLQIPYRIYQKENGHTSQMFFNQKESHELLKKLYCNAGFKLERKYRLAEKYF